MARVVFVVVLVAPKLNRGQPQVVRVVLPPEVDFNVYGAVAVAVDVPIVADLEFHHRRVLNFVTTRRLALKGLLLVMVRHLPWLVRMLMLRRRHGCHCRRCQVQRLEGVISTEMSLVVLVIMKMRRIER